MHRTSIAAAIALQIAIMSSASAFSTSVGTEAYDTIQAGDCSLNAITRDFDDLDFLALIALQNISTSPTFNQTPITARYWPDASRDFVSTTTQYAQQLESNCALFNVTSLTISTDASTYSGASRLVFSFEGEERDGSLNQWSAEISAPTAADAPTTVRTERTELAAATNLAPEIVSPSGSALSVDDGASLVATFRSSDDHDSDGAGLVYSISGGADRALFSIDSSSGQLSFNDPADFANPADADGNNIYLVEVSVADSRGMTDRVTVAVTVQQVDTSAPTVSILGAPAQTSGLTPFFVTIQFSELVTGFVAGDIRVTNGTTGDFVDLGGGAYRVAIIPGGPGDILIDIAAGVAEDAAGNLNLAAAQLRIGNDVVARTQATIESFMSTRAGLIVQSQPDLVDRLVGGGAGQAPSLSGTSDNYVLGFATSLGQIANQATDELARFEPSTQGAGYAPFDVWIDGRWAQARDEAGKTVFGTVQLGAAYRINADLLIGVMAQIDRASRQDWAEGSAADGTGWMAGPYLVARLDEQLYVDLSLLGGKSTNHVDPLGLYVDTFHTDRWLATARLTGIIDVGPLTVRPMVSGSYFSETQQAYVDSLGNVISGQTIALGNVSFGPSIGYAIKAEGLTIEPSVAVSGNWDYNVSASGDAATALSARLGAAIRFDFDSGARLNLNASYSGIGLADRSAYGLGASLLVPLR